MAAKVVKVFIKNSDGQYRIERTEPEGFEDMLRKAVAMDPLFIGIEIGQNLTEGILLDFEIEE